ncbi:CRISPR-associated protein Csx11 [Thermoanaerobacter uzonensis]|uniref:CRISPR-associated protein Csx11 n=1 Tax=Thermoanaerobacter uzonensis TaxID=447593 RepID=UPI003D767828
MSEQKLELNNIRKYRDDILKAEIVSLLALWDKIDPNKQNRANINLNKKSLSNWENDIKYKKIKILGEDIDLWDNFLENWREWRRKEDKEYLLQVLYGVGESLNSGIDKGSPKDDIKVVPENDRWLSNPFGGFKNKLIYLLVDETSINHMINNLENDIKNFLNSKNVNWNDIELIKEKFKNLYCGLLSDDRFPINDVSLWEQCYMATTMFKASLSEFLLKNDKIQSLPKRMDIKWRILGIQYDKLALAEKGYKPQQIQWYRDKSREIDDEIKKLLEYYYPIGNEIYRDETGIYFLVGEDLGEDSKDESSLAKLSDELKEIEAKILDIFKEKSLDEFYLAIFATKASRGLMNLSYLLENAKENFLKADWSKKETNICLVKSESGRAKGVCQVCGQRLVFESNRLDEDKNICDVCYKEKTKGRIDKWLKDTSKETIWMDELKDKNDRVALVTMKFELHDWLNGDMLNSLLLRGENFKNLKSDLNTLLAKVKEYYINFLSSNNKNLSAFNTFRNLNSIKNFIKLFDKEGIQTPYEKVNKKIINLLVNPQKNILSSDSEDIMILDLFNRNFFYFLNAEWDNIRESNKNDKIRSVLNKNNEPIFSIANSEIFLDKWKNYYQNANLIVDIFCFAFIVGLIKNTLLERTIGDRWEEFIYKKLNDWDYVQNKPKKNKIDFDDRKINWQELDDSDIDFLSTLILQFLLRKNPSPARLRRIWESTQEFFEDTKKNLCVYAGIPDERRKRYYWENISLDDGEYYDSNTIFWVDKCKVYLISSLTSKTKFNLKRYDNKKDTGITLDLSNAKTESYQPYMSIIDPTPISWQFITPAEYVPNLIDNVMKKYDENFKFVYGKLPLHIGVVVQDYKKPLYVGIKALRKIRRDIQDVGKLEITVTVSKVKEKLKCQKNEELLNDTHSYYSLYKEKDNEDYEFYMKPDDNGKHWIVNIYKFNDDDKVTIVPNTFDFEFLDTNTRRNDIYYDSDKMYKRKIVLKNGRPYDLEMWEKFKKFKELFGEDNISESTRSTKLQNLISVIYDKWEDLVSDNKQIKNDTEEGIKAFLASSFVNILKLNNDKELTDGIKELFDIDKTKKDKGIYEALKGEMTTENLQLFLDMFEFWHKTLKEV